MDDFSVDIGEATFDAIMIEAQSLVIEAEDVENGGVKIVDGRDFFHGLIAELIGRIDHILDLLPKAIKQAHECIIGERRILSRRLESQRQELRWVMPAHNLRILARKLLAEREAREKQRQKSSSS